MSRNIPSSGKYLSSIKAHQRLSSRFHFLVYWSWIFYRYHQSYLFSYQVYLYLHFAGSSSSYSYTSSYNGLISGSPRNYFRSPSRKWESPNAGLLWNHSTVFCFKKNMDIHQILLKICSCALITSGVEHTYWWDRPFKGLNSNCENITWFKSQGMSKSCLSLVAHLSELANLWYFLDRMRRFLFLYCHICQKMRFSLFFLLCILYFSVQLFWWN